MAFSMSRFVAAMILTSVLSVCVPPARRNVVDDAGDQALARTRFAAKEHGRMPGRSLPDCELDLCHRLRIADDGVEMLLDQHLPAQRLILQRQPRARFLQLLVEPRI